jgi:ERCC4-type nuclease
MKSMSYVIRMRIDVRETTLIQYCKTILETQKEKYACIELEIVSLPIGDIILQLHRPDQNQDQQNNDQDQELVVIERKTTSDLTASIHDGRYEEQSFRLNGLPLPKHQIIYLIEGQITSSRMYNNLRSEQERIYAAMTSLFLKKSFSVWRSDSCHETAIILCCMALKIQRDFTKGLLSHLVSNPNPNPNLNLNLNLNSEFDHTATSSTEKKDVIEYAHVSKRVKKDNITNDNIGIIMLCCIPGISTDIAKAVLQPYQNSLPSLILSVQSNPHCLDNVTCKSRKISKTARGKIIDMCLSSSSSLSSSST